MAPGGSGKRKRGDRTWSQDSTDRQRPSPHRPENLNLAQQNQNQGQYQNQGYGREQDNSRGRGGRRPSRGGRGGQSIRSPTGPPRQGANQLKSPTTLQPMSPPVNQGRREQKDVPQSNTQPLSTPANPAVTEHSPSPKPKPKPYYYEHLPDTRVQGWDSSGRQEVVQVGIQARSKEDYVTLSTLYQEIVRSGLDGRIPPENAGATIKDVVGDEVPVETPKDPECIFKPSPFDARVVFLDTLSILTDSEHDNPDLRTIVLSTEISAALMRQILETPLLQSLGLIRDTFARMGIRKQTNLLYRQSNYNLLREESEGYSKLVTELFTTSNNGVVTNDIVEDTFERVKAMIGAFDMDVGRVLDVTLDVFAAVVVRQNRFFVKLLRTSSWWPKADDLRNGWPHEFQGGLPKWALPGGSFRPPSDEEREETERVTEARDQAFWKRVQEIGIKAYFELGRRRANEQALQKSLSNSDDLQTAEVDEDQRWIRETGTLPPRGNRVAAQLLGFKLRFYASPSRDPSDILPENLIFLTALLIKIGFISLRDLYPHLWPLDEAMEDVKEKKLAERAKLEMEKRPGGGSKNALAMAGALEDDTLPLPPPGSRMRETDMKPGTPARGEEPEKTASEKTEDKDALPEPKEQKVQLLKSLLAIGALPESLYILGRFPWLLDAYPELPAFLCRILHQSLHKVYSRVEPPPIFASSGQALAPDADQSGMPKGHVRLGEYPPRKVLRWAELDQQESPGDGNSYRFYWDEWADNIPCCRTVDDVFLLCSSLLNLLGVKIGLDPPLVTKLARIGKYSLLSDDSESNRARWLDLSKRLLVPALSLTSREPGVVNEVWEILKLYPRNTRYSIYAEWYQGQISRLPDIKSAFDLTKAETKDILKRISKNNLKHMARVLAKVAYSSPGIVINACLGQLEAYDNLIQLIVTCARYFSALGYDIMTWCLLSALGRQGRNRVQADGMLTSKWLGSLALFAGRVFKQYEGTDCSPVLQYVAEQLRQYNSTDLIILEQLTTNLGGIVSDSSFNDAQVQAMGGGKLLQLQTMLQLLDKRNDTKGGSKRLMKALIDTKLVGELLISISQERKTCVFRVPEEDAHLKLLGNLFDEIHRVLTQYLDLLRYNLSIEDFDKFVPDAASLIGEFGLEPEIAFWISRESIASAMAEADKAAQELAERSKSETMAAESAKDVNGDVVMADEQTTTVESAKEEKTDGVDTGMEVETTANGALEKGQSLESASSDAPAPSPLPAVETNEDSTPWHVVLQDQMEKLRDVLPENSMENLGLPFYVTFWQLSLFDLHIPAKAYEVEIDRQKKNAFAIGNDRSDLSAAGTKRKEMLKKETVKLQDQLLAENKSHLKAYSQTRMRLQKEKEHWFTSMRGKYDLLSIALLEQCFVPRILLSAVDSFYCFKMFKFLHSSGTPNFRTLLFLDQLFREQRLTSLIFLCTSKEAENFGRFLSDVLGDLHRWHADKALYEKEAFGPKKDLPGFARGADAEGKPGKFLEFEDFRRLLYKWHRQFGNALKTCFTGDEYMHIRNSIVILKTVHQVFPAVNWMGHAQVGFVTKLSESETREDLKLAATSLIGALKRREKQWILPQAFHVVSQPAKTVADGTANSTKSETPVNGVNGVKSTPSTPIPSKAQLVAQKSLNAAATEFKPSAMNDDNKPQASGKLEVEDGEIEDAKMTDVGAKVSVEASQPTSQGREASQEKPKDLAAPKTVSRQASAPPAPSPKPKPADLPPSRSTPIPAADSSKTKGMETPSTTPAPPKDVKSSADPAPRLETPRRPEIDRAPIASSAGLRSQHNLPNRPEPRNFRQYESRIPPRPPFSSGPDDRRDPRELRSQEHGRSGRLIDQDRDRVPPREEPHGPRDHGRVHERGILDREREYHDPHRPSDREVSSRAPDDRLRPLPRETRASTRDSDLQERSTRPRSQDAYPPRGDQDHASRDTAMAPPRSTIAAHPDRAALIDQPPERAAMVNGDRDRRSDMSRAEVDDRRNRSSRPSSRPTSPRRHDDRGPRADRREERPPIEERRGPPDNVNVNQIIPPIRDDRPVPAPRDRATRPPPFEQSAANDSQKDSRPALLPPPKFESNHGRLNQDTRYNRQDGPSQDRMNAPPDIPSGPRSRVSSGRGGRGGGANQPHLNTQVSAQSSQPAERQPPTGPSSGRPNMRSSNHHDHPSSAPASTPSTPTVQTSETSGIHPSRLTQIQSPVEEGKPGQAKNSAPRANLVHAPPPNSGLPPSGPRSSQISPTATQPPRGPSGPQAGPSFGAGERGRGDKRFASLQQTLAGGHDRGGMGASIRGRGGRQGGPPNQSPQNSAPPTPGPEQYPPAPNGRPDLFASQNNEPAQHSLPPSQVQPRQDEDQRGPPGRRRPDPGISSETRRSTRHSSSRNHSAERERDQDRRAGHENDTRLPSSGVGRRDELRDNREHDHLRGRHPEANINPPRDVDQHESRERREPREPRESSSRRLREVREDPNRPREDPNMINPPPKRQRRGERDEYEGGYDRRPLPPPPPPPHQPQMPASMEEERRWGGRDHRETRDRDAHREGRDRERDRDRDRRDGNSGNGSMRKRGRPPGGDEGDVDREGGSGRGGGPGGRPENKRPRRGPP